MNHIKSVTKLENVTRLRFFLLSLLFLLPLYKQFSNRIDIKHMKPHHSECHHLLNGFMSLSYHDTALNWQLLDGARVVEPKNKSQAKLREVPICKCFQKIFVVRNTFGHHPSNQYISVSQSLYPQDLSILFAQS